VAFFGALSMMTPLELSTTRDLGAVRDAIAAAWESWLSAGWPIVDAIAIEALLVNNPAAHPAKV
jgi:hypothetical protein